MNIIHTTSKKLKKRKPTANQRELASSWELMMKKYETKSLVKSKKQDLSLSYSLGIPAGRETPKHPSLPFTAGACALKPTPVYTGNAIKGFGEMHKSNLVPVFDETHIIEIARMRR